MYFQCAKTTSGFKIEESQRQSWLSIAAVWAGGMICVPCLMIGGVLAGGGLSLGQIVLSILIGYGIICAYMIFIGMQACDTGLPVSVMASGALGEKGARYIISTLLAIACVGWFGIQSATCGSAFASMVASMLGMEAIARLRDHQLHRLGRHHAGDGLRRLQGPQVAQLHRRSAAGDRLPVRPDRRYRHK